jgi:nucleoside-diphosphate-sugar epimerase
VVIREAGSGEQRVAITGSTGYLGSRLLRELSGDGQRPLPITRTWSASVAPVDANHAAPFSYDGSIERLGTALRTERISTLVHLAGKSMAARDASSIRELVDANLQFGIEVLEASRQSGVRNVLFAASYWQEHGSEHSPLSLYASLKSAFEEVLTWYRKVADIRALVLVLPDVVGIGDRRAGKVIPTLCRAAVLNESVDASGGDQYLHPIDVRDVVRAFRVGLNRVATLDDGALERWQVSPSASIRLRDLVDEIGRLGGRPVRAQWGAVPYREFEFFSPWRVSYPLPGWEPETSLESLLGSMLREAALR